MTTIIICYSHGTLKNSMKNSNNTMVQIHEKHIYSIIFQAWAWD